MKSFFYLFFTGLIFLSIHFVNGQSSTRRDSTSLHITTTADSMKIPIEHEITSLDNTKFYIFKNLIYTNFNGFGEATRFNLKQQLFDFAEMGRPQYAAPVNMYPQQVSYLVHNVSMNAYSNGMFNTRFLSADQTDNMDYAINPVEINSVAINFLDVNAKKPYTRLKYYGGDQNYTDLDIFFVRHISDNLKLQLAGFNKGFDGYFYNSKHTGVAYNTKLSYHINATTDAEFSWLRNHEINGMGMPVADNLENFTYQADVQRFDLRFYFDHDTLTDKKITLGLLSGYNYHRNRSEAHGYNSTQNSDDRHLYLSKDFSDSNYSFTTTLNIENHSVYGSVFQKEFNETIFSLNIYNRYNLSDSTYLKTDAEIKSLDSFNPVFGFTTDFNLLHSNMFTQIKACINQRLPDPVERKISYRGYTGNSELKPETLLGLSVLHKWQVSKSLFLQGDLGYNQLHNEITFTDSTFQNRNKRSWLYLTGQGQFQYGIFTLSAGGRIISANEYVSPKRTLWSEATLHLNLFGGIIIFDLSAFSKWRDGQNKIYYNPYINRFYSGPGKNHSFMNAGFKGVATISDAEVFFEMDNLLQQKNQIIEGYYSDFRRVRFGVNWVLWN